MKGSARRQIKVLIEDLEAMLFFLSNLESEERSQLKGLEMITNEYGRIEHTADCLDNSLIGIQMAIDALYGSLE